MYAELCKRVRHLLPARFRTSLEALMLLACQVRGLPGPQGVYCPPTRRE